MSIFLSVSTVYLFILFGFFAKKIFKEKIEQSTLILISLYFLQPILTFWGLTRNKIDTSLILAPLVYLVIVLLTLAVSITFGALTTQESKERSIVGVAPLIGNTANLGIPLGIALFGQASVGYTSIINIANVFFLYTIGLFFYAKSSFSLTKSLLQILKIPILYSAILAIFWNINGLKIDESVERFLTMGAYATIVIQLIIFGIYLASVKIKTIDFHFSAKVITIKHLLLPVVGFGIIALTSLDSFVAKVLFMELIVPLAVNNVNIAALYDCNPHKVTEVILSSSLFFLLAIFFYIKLFNFVG